MIEVRIVDLPKGFEEWTYKPFRSTVFLVRIAGSEVAHYRTSNLQDPLILHVGDSIFFESEKEIPLTMYALAAKTSAHPIYARIYNTTKESVGVQTKEQPAARREPLFGG